jgi:hypothetical protein
MKRIPVNRKDMQQNKESEHGFDSIKTQRALTGWRSDGGATEF